MKSLAMRFSSFAHSAGKDSLLRNAAYLMASTGIMSVLGFGFWIFVAHLYTPGEIGEASALISITLLLSNLSFFGLNSAFVRFLPTSKNQSRDINAALITVSFATLVAAVIYLGFAPHFGGKLAFLVTNGWSRLLFIFLMVAVALNTLTDSIFIANRRAEFHTIVYTVFGSVKLILPLLLISLGSLGIFSAYMAAVLVSLLLSFYFMRRFTGYRLLSRPNWNFISRSRRYTTSNYLGSLLWGLPSQLMPTLIIVKMGDVHAAYFSMAWTMANLLYVIPSAITNSLLAETSHEIKNEAKNLKHAVRILALILLPVVGLSIIVAPYLLRLFGGNYAANGTVIFQLLALSTFFVAGNSIGNTIMNIEQRSKGIVGVQIVNAASTLGLAWLLSGFGLVGIGFAMLGGNIIGCLLQLALLSGSRHRLSFGLAVNNTGPNPAVLHELMTNYSLGRIVIGEDLGAGDRSSTNIITAGTEKYVIKAYRNDKRSSADVKAEIKFTSFLAKEGVPTPRLIPANDGSLVSKVTHDGVEWSCVVAHYEAGQTPAAYSPVLVSNMARIQAKIHTSGIEYAALTRVTHTKKTGGPFWAGLLFYGPKGLSHFDYDGSNILFDDSGNVSCVLDFEGMRYDSLVVCIVFTLVRLHGEARDPALVEGYVKHYQAVRKLNWLEKTCIRLALATRYRSLRLLALRY